MADNFDAPMSPRDHVLANALLCLATSVIVDAAEEKMLLDILADAARGATAINPRIRAMARAADVIVALRGTSRGSAEWVRATLEGKRAVNEWARWRLGLALDRTQEPA